MSLNRNNGDLGQTLGKSFPVAMPLQRVPNPTSACTPLWDAHCQPTKVLALMPFFLPLEPFLAWVIDPVHRTLPQAVVLTAHGKQCEGMKLLNSAGLPKKAMQNCSWTARIIECRSGLPGATVKSPLLVRLKSFKASVRNSLGRVDPPLRTETKWSLCRTSPIF